MYSSISRSWPIQILEPVERGAVADVVVGAGCLRRLGGLRTCRRGDESSKRECSQHDASFPAQRTVLPYEPTRDVRGR